MAIDPAHPRAAAIGAGGLVAALLLASLLGPEDEPGGSAIELSAPSPQIAPSPPPAASAASAPSSASPSLEGIRLHGIVSGGAILAVPGKGQRLVRVEREVVPGVTLAGLRQDRIILAHGATTIELGFAGEAAASDAQAGSNAGQAASPAAPGGAARGSAAARRQALEYRLRLAPQRVGGRTIGFALRPGAQLPVLQRAGLRPGDVILSVNRQAFDSEEKVQELPMEIAGSYTAEFEIQRAGRRMTLSLPVNPRPAR